MVSVQVGRKLKINREAFMSEIVLRTLQPHDRAAIECLLQAVGVFSEAEIAIGLELVDETLLPGPSTDYRWIIAESCGSLVGFACYGPVPLTVGTYDLFWITVCPTLHGTAVASQLDDAVTRAVRSQGGRWLLAETASRPAFARAQRFYSRQGYEQLSRIADFYAAGDDRLIFGKRLDI